MISSMTAFAAAEQNDEHIAINVEMRAVNSRHLDIVVRLPGRLAVLEERVKSTMAKKVSRGRIDTFISVRDSGETAAAFEVDEARADAYFEAFKTLQHRFGLDKSPGLELLAGTSGLRGAGPGRSGGHAPQGRRLSRP